ncbi:glutamine amidotransferase-related protein [Echinimonas agarilytica]|uniref:Glutamine amidotransferase domain-containing protein n=1 Tax=Echinimonas agarilytica TaxID=1215918 RepID=A0AA41W6Y0_9GAMM|nr:hypothetical protein [Echinimonas agarilytica]MCM2679909.1 hypothetical protein [Echinimonas agarilytica]
MAIAILNADELDPTLVSEFHSYGYMFEQLFAPLDIDCDVFDVRQGEYPIDPEHYHSFLITGSKSDAFGKELWIQDLKSFTCSALNRGAKFVGICFGHQLLALLLDGKVSRAEQGWGLGVMTYQCDSQYQGLPTHLSLIASHQDQVIQLPEDAKRLYGSDFCPNASFLWREQVLTFQGHPEFTPNYLMQLMGLRQGRIPHKRYQKAVSRLNQAHDGVLIGRLMAAFLK